MAKENDKVTKPTNLSCDTIGDMDSGIARALVDKEIQIALDDLLDRGEEDEKPRKVVVEIQLAMKDGVPVANVAAQAKLPPRRTRSTVGKVRMRSKGKHEFLFQPSNADDPDQGTFNMEEDKDE